VRQHDRDPRTRGPTFGHSEDSGYIGQSVHRFPQGNADLIEAGGRLEHGVEVRAEVACALPESEMR